MRTSASQRVFEVLREAILTGVLSPGEHLLEEVVAEDLGVSRVPVREALVRLHAEGLVTRGRGGRTTVRQLTLRDVEEISYVRRIIEQAAVELACQAPPDDRESGLVQLEEILRKEALELDNPDSTERQRLNLDFHVGLVTLGGNNFLKQTLVSVLQYVRLVLITSPHVEANVRRSHEEHLAILEAIRNGDVRTAQTILETHLERTKQNTLAEVRAGELRSDSPLKQFANKMMLQRDKEPYEEDE